MTLPEVSEVVSTVLRTVRAVLPEGADTLRAAVAVPVFPGWPGLIAGFFLFRLFDIVKPWPARRLEKLPRGWGIVVDDLVAGVYALVALVLLRMTFPDLLT